MPVSIFRSSRSQMFFKIDNLKDFALLTRNHMCRSLFLMKFQGFRPITLLKRGSSSAVFF